MTLKIHPAEGYGAHVRDVAMLADEVQAVRNIAETAAGGGIDEAPIDGTRYTRKDALWVPDVGFDDAPADSVRYVRQGNAWVPAVGVGNMGLERLIDSESTSSMQAPSGVGPENAVLINFGPAVKGDTDPVKLSAAGVLQVNESGLYRIKIALQFGRTNSNGTSVLLFRALVNGVQAGRSVVFTLASATTTRYFENDTWLYVPAGATISFEAMRDSSGSNTGGLIGTVPAGGWNTAPSAALRVERFTDLT